MANDPQPGVANKGYGLAAIGSSTAWDLTIDESLDQESLWEAELEGPRFYLTYSFHDIKIPKKTLNYLESRTLDDHGSQNGESPRRDGLILGQFVESDITLIWDDEDFDRCFLIIGPSLGPAIRLSLFGDDIKMLIQAFRKVVNQLSINAHGTDEQIES